jgi:hypothetical protein
MPFQPNLIEDCNLVRQPKRQIQRSTKRTKAHSHLLTHTASGQAQGEWAALRWRGLEEIEGRLSDTQHLHFTEEDDGNNAQWAQSETQAQAVSLRCACTRQRSDLFQTKKNTRTHTHNVSAKKDQEENKEECSPACSSPVCILRGLAPR